MNRQPVGAQDIGKSSGPADQRRRSRAGADCHKKAVSGFPRAVDSHGLQVVLHIAADTTGGIPERDFTKG